MGFFSHNTTQTTQLAQTPLHAPPLASPLTTSTSFPSFSDPLRSSFLFPLSSLLANGPDFNSLQKVIGHSEGCQSVSANANQVGGYKQENSWFLPQISSPTPTSFASSLQPPAVDLQAVFSLCALRNSELLPTTSPTTTTTKGTKSDDTAKSKTKQIKRKAVELEVEKTSVVTKQRVEAKQTSAPKQKPKRRIKYCKMDDCMKYAQGGTDFCVSHGGGRRCTVPGCKTGARGSTKLCILHGGGNAAKWGDARNQQLAALVFASNMEVEGDAHLPDAKKLHKARRLSV